MTDRPSRSIHRDDLLEVLRLEEPSTYRLVGEVDLSNADRLAALLRSDPPPDVHAVTLDLSGCTYIGSEGIAVLMEVWRRLRGRGALVLRQPPDTVRRTLEVAGLDRLPDIRLEEAVE